MKRHKPMIQKAKVLLSLWLMTGLGLVCQSAASQAGTIRIAVAANFTPAAKEIGAAFEAETGHHALLSFGSSGKFYAQIVNGAPFDVFLSADQLRPIQVDEYGAAVKDTRFTYAIGKLVLYSTDPSLVDEKAAVLTSDRYVKLAIANPITAPYGIAAMSVLQKLNALEFITPKLVKGDNIAQTYQFVITQNAQLGFVAKSQMSSDQKGSRWEVPQALYDPIKQDAVLLQHGSDNEAARAFYDYLRSDKAKAIIKSYGYATP